MAVSKQVKQTTDDLLRDLMIVQMGLAGVGQREIQQIVGVSMNRVNDIVKRLKKGKKDE
jgi:transposase